MGAENVTSRSAAAPTLVATGRTRAIVDALPNRMEGCCIRVNSLRHYPTERAGRFPARRYRAIATVARWTSVDELADMAVKYDTNRLGSGAL